MPDELNYPNWRVFSPEELADLEPGEKVITRTEQWNPQERQHIVHFEEWDFIAYSPGRGIVTLRGENYRLSNEFCDATVGRSAIPEHYELHGDFSEEDY